jgi:hypothetical protein
MAETALQIVLVVVILGIVWGLADAFAVRRDEKRMDLQRERARFDCLAMRLFNVPDPGNHVDPDDYLDDCRARADARIKELGWFRGRQW